MIKNYQICCIFQESLAGAKMRKGVYAWVSGPNYETDGDIAALRSMGVDAVGCQ